jgi:hypothetical protein
MTGASARPIKGSSALSKALIVLSVVIAAPMVYALLFGVSHGAGPFFMFLIPGGVIAAILALVAVVGMVHDASQRTPMTYVAVAFGIASALVTILPWF